MCGIFGIVANEDVTFKIIEALRRLEYRGYDSAGLAVMGKGGILSRRIPGKISDLARLVARNPVYGHVGVGHTRWATHGAATEINAHPHISEYVAVVHNGIIENYHELKLQLASEGVEFITDTDTEVIVHLCTQYVEKGMSPEEAMSSTVARLEGAFSICVLFNMDDYPVISFRKGVSLAVGYGCGEMYVASDTLALSPLTNRITYLDEGDMVVMRSNGQFKILDITCKEVERTIHTVSVPTVLLDKDGYRHFMLKEIHEQPSVVGDTLSHYEDMRAGKSTIQEDLQEHGIDLEKITNAIIIGCGTAYYAGMIARYWFGMFTNIRVTSEIASEFRYMGTGMNADSDIGIFISQSGETADTLASLRWMKKHGTKTIAIVNAPQSTMAREADIVFQIYSGPEISVASTKAFSCQLACILSLVICFAVYKGTIDKETAYSIERSMAEVPRLISEVLTEEKTFQDIGHDISRFTHALYLGRGLMYPVALEGALKLKEVSYIHAEGYACGELKHGPMSLVEHDIPVFIFAPSDSLFDKTVANAQEIIARDGKVIFISDKSGHQKAGIKSWRSITLPSINNFMAPMVYVIPAQMVAYYTAVAKGTDVDQPRNLAKAVTVE